MTMWKVSLDGGWFNLHDVRSEGLPTDRIMANRDILDLATMSTMSTKSTFSSVYIRTVFIVIMRGNPLQMCTFRMNSFVSHYLFLEI